MMLTCHGSNSVSSARRSSTSSLASTSRCRAGCAAATLSSIAKTTGGTYYPALDTSQLDRVGSTIDLRLTVANRRVPLAGAFIALALALLAAGAAITIVRSGRVV